MSEVLSIAEEEVLSMMRALVADVRQRLRSSCMEELKRSLIGAGATVSDETAEETTFSMRKVQFKLRVIPNNVSSVELTFIESSR